MNPPSIPSDPLQRRGLHNIAGGGNPVRLLDIVFIHGLDGDAYETWMTNKADARSLWPSWLADDFPDQVGVWTVGYAASGSGWKEQSMPVADRGLSMLDEMVSSSIGQRPVVFITHSMGGIVAKQMLRLAGDQGVDRYETLVSQTCGIAFLATPHSGAALANFATLASLVYRTNEQLTDLRLHDPRLRELHGAFLSWLDKRRSGTLPGGPVVCRTYAERRELRASFIPKGVIVVDQTSAEPNISGERAIPLDEDHISIAKPASRATPLYKSICGFLRECVLAAAKARVSNQTSAHSRPAGGSPDALETLSARLTDVAAGIDLLLGDATARQLQKATVLYEHDWLLNAQKHVQAVQQIVETEGIKTRRQGLHIAAAILLLLLGIGFGLHSLTTDHRSTSGVVNEIRKDVTEIKSLFARERKFMALILARANDRITDWETMTPAQRFDLALDQIAAEQKIAAKELRDLLDLYVQRVEADPDAEAEDKYYVLMRKQAFEQAAQLAGTEGQTAEARMKQQAYRKDAAKAIQENAAAQEKLERQRASDFYHKEGDAYKSAVQFEKALVAFRRAAALTDASSYPETWVIEHNQVALMLLDLARYDEAEPLFRDVLDFSETLHGKNHPHVATMLSNLALILQATNRLVEAEPLMNRALQIDEAFYGKDHPSVATRLNNFALLLLETNRLAEAEPLMKRALQINEASDGKDHPNFAVRLSNLATLLKDTDRLTEAEPMMNRALQINEASYGKGHPKVAINLINVAQILQATNRLAEAEPLMKRALQIDETSYGKDHPSVARDVYFLATLLLDANRLAEAEPLMKRALQIDEASYGKDHPSVARDLDILATLFLHTDRLVEAEPLMKRALQINEASYGKDHTKVAASLNNLAQVLKATNRLVEAEPLMRRALQIDEASYGKDHPQVGIRLNNLALLLKATNRLAEAEPMSRRMVGIFLRFQGKTGHRHPHISAAIDNYFVVIRELKLTESEIHIRLDAERGKAGLEPAAFEVLWAEVLARNYGGPYLVTVMEVLQDSQGAILGLQAGDVVLRYHGEAITSREQLIKLTGEKKDESIPLEIQRGNETLKLTVKPGRLGLAIENRMPPATLEPK